MSGYWGFTAIKEEKWEAWKMEGRYKMNVTGKGNLDNSKWRLLSKCLYAFWDLFEEEHTSTLFFSLTMILNHNWNKKFTLQIVGNFLKSKAFWFYPSTLPSFFIWLALSIGKLLVYLFCMLLAVQERIMQKHYGFETLAAILVIFIGMWLAAGELVYGKCC